MAEEKNLKDKNLVVKPPVVVVLGHVDHGKSSLLEAIKKEIRITAKESGGITQHIGAYEVKVEQPSSAKGYGGRGKITFIDTPGHEAFSAMRSRGAKVADIAVLVVDAQEGVKTQTKEAIEAVKRANIPLIVVLNKIDKQGVQPEWVMGQLKESGLVVEKLGGKVPVVKTSAVSGQGVDELLETILLVAEMEELKTDISAPAQGTIIESALDNKKGPIASLILEKGILKQGDILGTASAIAKAKMLTDFSGFPLKEVYPSQPVQVLGFDKVPKVGEQFKVFPDIFTAQKEIEAEKEKEPRVLEVDKEKKVLNLILKADVLGSLEAIENILLNIPQEEVVLRIIKSEVGNIGVSDINLAESAKAKIFGFRVKIDETAKSYIQQKKAAVKIFEVIYELVEEVRKEMEKKMGAEVKRVDLGKVKILVIFKKGKDSQIIGGKVVDGEITSNTLVEVLRENEVIGKGRIKGLQQEKKDIAFAGKGREVGMFFVGDVDIEENDILTVFKEEKEKKTL